MIWHFIYLVVPLLWDSLRFSLLAPDDKTVELLLLRQQLLIVRRHQKRGPTVSCSEVQQADESNDAIGWVTSRMSTMRMDALRMFLGLGKKGAVTAAACPP